MTPSQMIDDFAKRKGYGSLEFEFRDGEITFIRRKETFITVTHGKNPTVAPTRGEHGVNNGFSTENYR